MSNSTLCEDDQAYAVVVYRSPGKAVATFLGSSKRKIFLLWRLNETLAYNAFVKAQRLRATRLAKEQNCDPELFFRIQRVRHPLSPRNWDEILRDGSVWGLFPLACLGLFLAVVLWLILFQARLLEPGATATTKGRVISATVDRGDERTSSCDVQVLFVARVNEQPREVSYSFPDPVVSDSTCKAHIGQMVDVTYRLDDPNHAAVAPPEGFGWDIAILCVVALLLLLGFIWIFLSFWGRPTKIGG